MDKQKKFTTKRYIFGVGILIIVVVIILLVQAKNNSKKPSKELIAAVNEAWNLSKSEEQPIYMTKIDELSSYKLNSMEIDEDRYIIKAVVTASDLGSQLSKIDYSDLPQTRNEDELNTFLCQQIEEAEMKRTEVEIFAYNINGKYHISFSDEFVDAMSGNVYSYSQTTLVDMLQKYQEGELK